MKKYFLITIILFSFLVNPVFATGLYFDSSSLEVGPGDSLVVDVKIDASECINVIKTEVNYPSKEFELLDFTNGASIITFWVDNPGKEEIKIANSNGKILFSGGIPGGYCGEVPGDPGDSNVVATLIFKLPEYGKKEVKKESLFFNKEKTEFYLNDGFGTKIEDFDLKKLEISIKDIPTITGDLHDAIMGSDNIRPEPFVVYLRGGDNLFDGLNYIVFSTNDKQTGIDYYEVLEIFPWETANESPDRNIIEKIFKVKKRTPIWETASTPFRLKDQSLSSIIKVRAVDKAGNERMVEYIPDRPIEIKKIEIENIIILVLLILIFVLFGYLLLRRISKRNDKY